MRCDVLGLSVLDPVAGSACGDNTDPTKRYPRFGIVSMKRGDWAESPKRFPNPLHRIVQGLIKINECIGGPESLAQILAGDQFPRVFQQPLEHFNGLPLQAKLHPLFS